MTDSQRLLAEYAETGSESAFQKLVLRYINFVYSTALRLVGGDAHLAEDVAQTVFISLAKRGRALSSEVMLGGWLHQHTYHVATKAVRAARRRQSREREAMEMNALHNDPGANLRQVTPILDEALTQLGTEDRTAILLRFFEQRDFRSVGEALGSSEDAARMRVNRALEKLHSLLKRRGITFSAAALGTVLTTEAATIAPTGLATAISSVAFAGATAGTGTTLATLKFMATTKLKLGIGTIVLAGVTTVLVIQHQSEARLRRENQSLRQQIAQLQSDSEGLSKRDALDRPTLRLPAPSLQATAQSNASAEDLQATNINLYSRFKDQAPKLTAEQVEAYLKANGRKASNLLAAYRTSGDPALLKEAMEKYPNDPQVAFEAVLDKDLSPEQQRQWLDTFEKSAPDNALANYLSAFNYFKAGQTDAGIQELTAASGKQLTDYTLERMQADEEAYLAAGYSAAEAEMIADGSLECSQLSQVKQLGRNLIALSSAYSQSGDPASAQAALQMAMNMGQRYADEATSPTLISQLMGKSIEVLAFNAMDPNSPYGGNGQTVQDQLNQIAQQRAAVTELVRQAEQFMPTMSDQDILNYENRRKLFGEVAAVQWIVNKYGQQ